MTNATLPIFSKAFYATRPFAQTLPEPPLGSGAYRIADFRPGTYVTHKRRDDYWAKDSQREPRPLQLRRAALRVLPRPHRRARESVQRHVRPARGIHVAARGHRLRRAARQGRPHPARHAAPDESLSGAQGFFINTQAQVPGPARAQGARPRLRLRVVEQEPVLRPLQAHDELLREPRHEGKPARLGRRTSAAGAVP